MYKRQIVDKLETKALPLGIINWDLYAGEGDFSQPWPPSRFQTRNNRLALYDQLYNGIYTGLLARVEINRVSVNPFRRLCSAVSEILTAAPIEQTPEIADPQVLSDVAAEAITSVIKNGGALIRTGNDGEEFYIDTVDPACWYPMMDGGHVIACLLYTSPSPRD